MGNRNIATIIAEGQAKTLETLPLMEKKMAGTLTAEESNRLAMLEGNLLALMKEAQAQGVGVAVGTEYRGEPADNDEDEWADETEDDNVWLAEDEDGDEENSDEVGNFRFY